MHRETPFPADDACAVIDPTKLPGGDRAVCALCGKPLRSTSSEVGEFCCAGCQRVYDVLRGLDAHAGEAYLAAARALGIVPLQEREEHSAKASAVAYPADRTAEREQRVEVTGMVCPSCTWIIEQVLLSCDGVSGARFDFFTGTGTVRFDLRRTSMDRLGEVLDSLGYRLSEVGERSSRRIGQPLTLAFLVAAVVTMNLMSLSAVRYAVHVGWLESAPSFLPWVELALCIPVLWLGWVPSARRACAAIRRGRITMDALVSISVAAAFVLSCAALVTSRPDIYFETAAGLVTIYLLSRMVEARLREKASRDAASIMRLDVVRTRVQGAGREETYRPIGEVEPGDRAVFHEGEIVAFDGEVGCQEVYLSEAVLTGEPRAVRRVKGDLVMAGATVQQGTLLLHVIRGYRDTALSRIAQAVRGALEQSEGRLRSADRFATWFAPAVLVVAAAAWLIRLGQHGMDFSLSAAGWFPSVSVLAVACPCGFSLAGVAAVAAATWALHARGFVVKDAQQLEDLHRTRTIVFDKTGTLTEGHTKVHDIVWRDGENVHLLEVLVAAEAQASHPIARAIRSWVADHRARNVPASDPGETQELPGQGRRLAVAGRTFTVGAAALFRNPFVPAGTEPSHTLVWFGWGDEAEGCARLTDEVKQGASATVAALRASGRRVEVLSGDRQEMCDWIAEAVGADAARGDMAMDQKAEHIASRVAAGETIALVGDGTNDALAMSRANASVAMGGATDEAILAAGFVMVHRELPPLVELFRKGDRLMWVVRTNVLWAFGFNTVFIPIAAVGLLTPLAAMLLMLVSSLGVLLNSLRLRR